MKKIIITGNVGRDPEMRADQTGNQFASFSVGVSVGTKQNPKTDWVDVTCNGKLSDLARNYIKKGSKLLVEGFPSVNAYLNRENKPVGTLRIYASNIEFLSKREDATGSDDTTAGEPVYNLPEVNQAPMASSGSLTSDDIPF
jgi:single-strand DNA-binding protein